MLNRKRSRNSVVSRLAIRCRFFTQETDKTMILQSLDVGNKNKNLVENLLRSIEPVIKYYLISLRRVHAVRNIL